MKKSLFVFLLAIICSVFFCSTIYAADENTQILQENSWRYKNGQVVTDLYATSLVTDPYHPDATFTGIDVSHHQGRIDWEKVKESDVDFVIIRCGYAEDKTEYDDRYWEYNVSACERLGIPYGVYLYSYAENVEDALSEADHVLRLIDGKNLSMPIYYDLEENYMIETEMDFAAVATAFCEKIAAAGYPVGIYANLNWWTHYLTDECFDNWYRWVARWNNECGYDGDLAIWQYYNMGVVDGINGDVDMNFLIGTPSDHKVWTEKMETPVLTLEKNIDEKPILSWNIIDGATEYQVWRKTKDNKYSLYKTVTESSLTDSDVVEDNVYHYMVKAVSSDGQKGNSYFSEEKYIELSSKKVVRVKGETRYETSIAIADFTKEMMGVDKFNTIIVASGLNFADALAGIYFADVKDAPIIMSNGKNDAQVKEYIDANLVSGGRVYILGSTNTIPESTEKALKGSCEVERLWGETRYETNIAILKEAGVTDQEILVCSGEIFADSLSASAVGKPILLVNTQKGSLTESQKEYLSTIDTDNFYIIGSKNTISDSLAAEVNRYGDIERVWGETRYETSVAIAERFFTNPESVIFASAKEYPDGLCGGALATSVHAPIILSNTGTSKVEVAKTYVQNNYVQRGVVLGGDMHIDDATAKYIFDTGNDIICE